MKAELLSAFEAVREITSQEILDNLAALVQSRRLAEELHSSG